MTRNSLRAVILSSFVVAGIGLSSLAPAATAAQPEFASYIVTVAKGSEQSVQARAKALGGEIGYVYTTALNGFSVRMPVAAAEGLARLAGVARVELDAIATTDASQPNPPSWGLDRIDQRDLPLDNIYVHADSAGSNVRAYVIDTGVRSSHQDFGGRVLSGKDFVGDGRGTDDCNGHGTHVSGTIGGAKYGVAKLVNLVPVRVFGCTGGAAYSTIISAVQWVMNDVALRGGPAVVNMSIGGPESLSLESAVESAVGAGIVVVVAAGNENVDACTKSPAGAASAITVGATTSTDARASYSNFGACLDIFAPGSSILSAYYSSNTATATLSGTSMATPHVTGSAALYLGQNLNATVADVTTWLTTNASLNRVSSAGSLSPNLMLYTGAQADSGGTVLTAPGPITNLVLSQPVGTTSLLATWSPGSGGTPTGYTVSLYRSSNGRSYSLQSTASVFATSTSYSTSAVVKGYYYMVRVTASNSAGTSGYVQSSPVRIG